jgi:hypothetical protein
MVSEISVQGWLAPLPRACGEIEFMEAGTCCKGGYSPHSSQEALRYKDRMGQGKHIYPSI